MAEPIAPKEGEQPVELLAPSTIASATSNTTTSTKPSLSSLLKTTWKYKHLLPVATGAFIKHYTSGPAHPSWPVQTTLFTTIMKHTTNNQPIRDPNLPPLDPIKTIQSLRKSINFEGLMSEPKNGFTCDIKIEVKKRGYKGVLEGLDSIENGDRTIPAQWVIHNNVYNSSKSTDKVVLYFHGGAYIMMSPKTATPITLEVSAALNSKVLSVDYRLAPEAIFPSALQDAMSAYDYLVDLCVSPENIVLGGDSAGGGLCLSLFLYLRDCGKVLPSMLLLSPWVESTSSLDSWTVNAETDYLSLANPNQPEYLQPMHMYLGKDYEKHITHPYVLSSLASFHSNPTTTTSDPTKSKPTTRILIQTGSSEVLLSESSLLYKSILTTATTDSNIKVDYQILEGGIHVSMAFVNTEISKFGFESMKLWAEENGISSTTTTTTDESKQWKGEGREKIELMLKKEGSKKERLSSSTLNKKKQDYNYTPIDYELPIVKVRSDGNEFVKLGVERVEKRWAEMDKTSLAEMGKVRLFEARRVGDKGGKL